MKKSVLALALVAAGLMGSAQAALVTIPFQYQLDFVDPTVAAELNFAASGLFSGSVSYDDASAPDALGIYDATGLNISFGSFSFTEADNISGFPAGVGVGATSNLTALFFETGLTLTQAAGAGSYLLVFDGVGARMTPSGDTLDYKVTASAVPVPAALPLFLAGLSVMGYIGRRRRQAEAG